MVQMVRRVRLLGLSMLGLAAFGLLVAAGARADFGVVPGSYVASLSSDQAGGHPDFSLSFAFNTHPDPTFTIFPDADAKTLVVDLPPGLIGNPQVTPKCRADALRLFQSCPADTQIGVIHYTLPVAVDPPVVLGTPLYNMVPQNDRVAELGFVNTYVVNPQIHILASVRTGSDYGVSTEIPRLPGNLHPSDASVEIWGVPSDPSHDAERGSVLDPNGGCLDIHGVSTGLCASHLPPRPFLSNPTQCSTPVSISMRVDSYQDPGQFFGPLSSTPVLMTGCDKLPFDPSISLKPTSGRAGAPSGYAVDVHVPQSDSAIVPQTADVKTVVVQLPQGVTVSPSAADGLQGCSDAQIHIHDALDPSCPDASKIGSVEIDTPLLPGPIFGSVYQGTQTPGHLLRVFLVAKGFGVLVKLPGSVDLNQQTGQITTTFDNNPQVPFEDFILKFKDGPRAPLVNPRTCGTKTTSATFTSYADQVVSTSSSFTISKDGNGAPCTPYGFSPTFGAHSTNPVGGAKGSSFTLHVARTDADQELSTITTSLPPGLVAKIAGVPLCGAVDAAAGTCGEASRVGSVLTGSGPGSHPFFLPGRAYITGPYKGQPFGLSIVVPAKAGPLDLGNVVVRASVQVRNDGSLHVIADPVPSMLDGIPLQVRSVDVTVDRRGFMVNPTNCDPMHVAARITSLQGAVAQRSTRFQVGDCGALPFKPKLSLSVGRKGHTGHGDSAPLTATLTQTPGQAAVRSATVTLPLALNALLNVVQNACTMAEFRSNHCEKARAGSAVAVTPLLKHALRGGVYFVKDPNKALGALPNMMVALRGQVDIDLTAHIKVPGGVLLQTTFQHVPDVPITKFVLSIVDGSHGPIGIATNLCSKRAHNSRATVELTGQNGKQANTKQRLHIHGCGKRKR